MAHQTTGTKVPALSARGVTPDSLAWAGSKAHVYAAAARPRRSWFRRLIACLSLSFCALLWADSASWATTPPPAGSPSESPSSEPSSTSPAEPAADPTADPSTAPEPGDQSTPSPSPEQSTALTGTEETPTVVQLETEQMAVLLLGTCIVSLCVPALVVIGMGNRG